MQTFPKLPPGLFVTATDTDVGKTYTCCQILTQFVQQGQAPGAYKPACSGAIPSLQLNEATSFTSPAWDDVNRLASAMGRLVPIDWICPQRFLAPLAPPLAAKLEGKTVDEGLLVSGAGVWAGHCDSLIVEGAGGLLSPISSNRLVADIAVAIGYPLLIVARPGLGTINATLLTIEAAHRRKLQIAGVVLSQTAKDVNSSRADENGDQIEQFSGVKVLGTFEFAQTCLRRHTSEVKIVWSELLAAPVSIHPGR
jgi:dethiobiotin synthetase